jgi:hypothetical protein
MINFSKVARQLEEQPRIIPNPEGFDDRQGRFQRNNAGYQGTQAEKDIVNVMSRHVKPNSQIRQLGDGANKADMVEKYRDSNNQEQERGYSIKATKQPDVPIKVQESKAQLGPRGSFRKLMMPGSDQNFIKQRSGDELQIRNPEERIRFLKGILGSQKRQAAIMAYGTDLINPQTNGADSLNSMKEYLTQGDLNQEQLDLLQRINDRGQKNPFMTPGEMEEFFPDHHRTMLKHLEEKKPDIFNQMIRQHDARYPNQNWNSYGDPKGVDRMIHLRGSQGEEMLPGKFDIRDISDPKVEEAMQKLDWFQDDNNFYLAEDETDDINSRILDIHPHTSRTDSWTFNPRRPRPGGSAKPGLLKATMGIDEEMLDRVFGESMYSADLERNGEGYRMSNIVNRINNGRTLNEKFIWREEINELQQTTPQ